MPILTVELFGRLISVFSVLFTVFSAYIIVLAVSAKKHHAPLGFPLLLVLWLTIATVSLLIGIIFFSNEQEWLAKIYSYLPKTLIYIALTLCAVQIRGRKLFFEAYLRGFILGCVLNLIWSIVEGGFFYLLNIPLNNIIFSDFARTLPEDRQFLTVISDDIIRASGFNIDPAHLGAIIPIVFVVGVFKKSFPLLGLSAISLIFSGSTTALVASIAALVISAPKLARLTIRIKPAYVLSAAVFVTCGTGLLLIDQVRDGLTSNITGFYYRTFENYVEKRDQGPRYIYHAYLPDAIAFNGLWTLTGTGFGTASHPYVGNPDISKFLSEESYYPFDPESTYISYLFDTGILGLFIYLYLLIRLLWRYRGIAHTGDQELIIYAALAAMFFAGFFYHYTLTAYHVMVLIWASVLWKQESKCSSSQTI